MPQVQKMTVSDRQEDLLPRWAGLWMAMGVLRVPDVTPLINAYTGSSRHYHDLHHLRACLRELDAARHLAADAPALELALWYHDMVYDPARKDNEEKSAELAMTAMKNARLLQPRIDAVHAMILATRHDGPPVTGDEKLIVDIDLSILGKPESEFTAYESAIREEYAHVPEADFRKGRAAVLRKFLDRQRIYATEFFHDRYEAPARENLRRAMEKLA
ncbi:MAG TPA: hypothetical protein VFE47_13505 [Tepidisphaeraceae bacterium]|jgi:predicted metal-dependent HD superfamily phosphohydrolase|nr:hypothetical protein [Tepidisphaeraceae bacterium]